MSPKSSPPTETLVTCMRLSAPTRVQGCLSFTAAAGGFFSIRVVRISSDLLPANGMMVELKSKSTRVIPAARAIKGEVIQSKLIPQLRIAVISWPRDSKPNVSSVAIRIASGAIWKEIAGTLRKKYVRTSSQLAS